jgi:predicted lipoprotein
LEERVDDAYFVAQRAVNQARHADRQANEASRRADEALKEAEKAAVESKNSAVAAREAWRLARIEWAKMQVVRQGIHPAFGLAPFPDHWDKQMSETELLKFCVSEKPVTEKSVSASVGL